jgi:hypothetical protein
MMTAERAKRFYEMAAWCARLLVLLYRDGQLKKPSSDLRISCGIVSCRLSLQHY